MNWLITGGAGFIGVNLVKQILNCTHDKIKIIDNFSNGTKQNFLKFKNDWMFGRHMAYSQTFYRQIELVHSDILDLKTAICESKDIDFIVHLAANTGVQPSIENPFFDLRNNIIGTINYLEAARLNKIKKFIFASSNAVIGEKDTAISEDMLPKPISPYGISKLAAEHYCNFYNHHYDVPTCILRFSNVYGPYSSHKNSVVAKFIRNVKSDKPLTIHGSGKQARDFLFVEDIVDIIRLIVKSKISGETYQIATGQKTSIVKLAYLIGKICQKKIKVKQTPPVLGDVYQNSSSIKKIFDQFGWKPETSLVQGLKKTIQ